MSTRPTHNESHKCKGFLEILTDFFIGDWGRRENSPAHLPPKRLDARVGPKEENKTKNNEMKNEEQNYSKEQVGSIGRIQ